MGFPAARIGDMHICPLVNPGPVPHVGGPISSGAPTVITMGMPQARVSDMAVCVGPPDMIAMGLVTVFVCSMPAARLSDMTAHGGTIVTGAPTVLIGDAPGSAGGGAGGAGGGMNGPGMKKTGSASGEGDGTESSGEAGGKMANRSGTPGISTSGGMANPSQQATTLSQASADGAPFCEACARAQAGQDAQAAADAMGARGHVVGDQLFPGQGGGSDDLASHEAAHTVQQGGGAPKTP